MAPPSKNCQNRRNTGERIEGKLVWRRCNRGALCSLKDLRGWGKSFTSKRWINVCNECEEEIGDYNIEVLS